jgi:multiple sugar transport system substrate-binding protein
MKNKLFRLLTMVMMVSILLAACGSSATPAAKEPVKVTIFVGFGAGSDPDSQEALKKIAQEFNDSHKDIQMEFTFSTWEEHSSKFSTLLAGGLAPDLAFPIGIQGIAEFYDEWVDVTPYIQRDKYDTSDFYGPSLQLLKFSDKTVGLPLGVYPSVVFFNEDLFDAAGVAYPPQKYGDAKWTYDEQMNLAKQLTIDANGNNATSPNFDPTTIKQWGWGGWCGPFRTIPGKFGGNPLGMSADLKKAEMNTGGYLEGMQFLYDSIYTWHVRPSSVEEGSTFTGLDFTFESGKVAMFECFSWSSYAFPNFTTAGNWNVAAVPAGPHGDVVAPVNADTFAISKHSKNPDQAWEVAKWLMEPDMQKRVCGILGCIPSRKSLAEGWVKNMTSQYSNVDFQVFIDSIDYMDASPNNEAWVPNYQKVWDATENAMSRILSGESNSPQQVVDELNTEVQGYLDEYWSAHK